MDRSKNKNIRVFYRIFPLASCQWEYVKIDEDLQNIYVPRLQELKQFNGNYWSFLTDGIFYNNSQEEIYKTVTENLLDKALKGTDSIIISYGQSGTGKSLTSCGLEGLFQDIGIAPRLLQDLFKLKESSVGVKKLSIFMSYTETEGMYYLTDLLNPAFNSLNHTNIKNVIVRKIRNEKHALQTLFEGESRKKFTENQNFLSHTCSTILTIHIYTKPNCLSEPTRTEAKIHILDLAAADSLGNVTCAHKSASELGNGNLIKSQLEQFALFLQEDISQHILVAKRLNILLLYLKDSLGTNSILKFIGHIRTDKENLVTTLSMLRMGHIIRKLKPGTLKENIKENEDSKYTVLKKKYDELYTEKMINSMITNTSLSNNINQERIKHMQNVTELYLLGKTNELILLNCTDTQTVLNVIKTNYNKLKEDYESTKASLEHAILVENSRMALKHDSSSLTKEGKKYSKKSLTSRSLTSKSSVADGNEKKSIRPMSKDRFDGRRSREGSRDHASLYSARYSKAGSSVNLKRLAKRTIGSSTSSVIKEETDLDKQLPESIPHRDSVWKLYIDDPEYNYNQLAEKLENYRIIADTTNKKYLEEVGNLQNCTKLFNIRKEQLRNCKMNQLFTKGEVLDEFDNPIKTELEIFCLENLKEAETNLVKQQENVLNHQAELQIAIDVFNNTRKDINDQFQKYLQDKYQTPLPDTLENETEKRSDEVSLLVKSLELFTSPESPLDSGMEVAFKKLKEFDHLKKQLKENIHKQKQKNQNRKQWILTAKLT